ncbi:DUF479 domain-containing protein [Bizionia argentinensis JUB59]|uniref:DUF479 domain-containing protein n=1 Tax=Bizionia argentinensis JUB59 TaxID=1046627 RepID=G2EFH6_9FLAO|nr:acyl carrier protein phosphodiesterase [Bizionia argentinensis]EGV42807.1 DUF479 domain-containing protein [Bizionia argentinensis JUB59]
MNFLAHIYLSNNLPNVTIGNFIADGIRGKQYKEYPKEIQIGILLHREIDTFTDAHPVVRKSTKKLHENYSHYSGVIVDILYDHFLAKNWTKYSKVPLEEYAQNFYDLLEVNYEILPPRTRRILPYMIANNLLVIYAEIDGIQRVLDGMNQRTKNKSKMNEATRELVEYYDEFEAEFTLFFEDLRVFAAEKLKTITNTIT